MKHRILKISAILGIGLLVLLIVASAAYVIRNYPRRAEPFEISCEHPEKSILIATQGSQFKNAFIKVLVDSLRVSPLYIKGIDLRNIEAYQQGEWDKIFILTTFMAILNRDATAFIDSAEYPQKILLMVTSGGADWQAESGLQVDAITSASHKSYIPDLVNLLSLWIQSDSSEQWQEKDYVLALRFLPDVNVSAACSDILSQQDIYKTRYPNLQGLINQAGYMFMRLDRLDSALEVFKLNQELFPDIWNVYDSYGEALLKSGNMEQAKIQYQQALKMNPASRSSQHALEKMGIHY